MAAEDLAKLTLLIQSQQVEAANKRMGELEDKSKKVEKATEDITRANTRSESSYLRLIGRVKEYLLLLVSVGTVAKSLEIAGEIEQSHIAFETLLGDAKAAHHMLEQLRDFAATTPFQLPGLEKAAQLLLAMGFAAKDVVPMLRVLGDTSAAFSGGEQMLQELAYTLGKIQSSGKLSGMEMRELATKGVPAWRLLADAIGVDIPRAMNLVEKGVVRADVALNAFLGGLGTKYKGATEKQAQTLLGLFSTLKDTIYFALGDVGTVIIEAFDLKGKLTGGIEAIDKFGKVVIEVVRYLGGLPPVIKENEAAAKAYGDAILIVVGALELYFGLALVTSLVASAKAFAQSTVWVLRYAFGITSAATQVSVLSGAIAALLAFEIGRYFYDEFKIVQQTSASAINILMDGWEYFKYGWKIMLAGLQDGWDVLWKGILKTFAEGLKKIADGLAYVEDLADDLGLNIGSSSGAIRGFANALLSPVGAGGGGNVDRVNKELADGLAKNAEIFRTTMKNIETEFNGKDRKGNTFFGFLATDVKDLNSQILQTTQSLLGIKSATFTLPGGEGGLPSQATGEKPKIDPELMKNDLEKMIEKLRDERAALNQGALALQLVTETRKAEEIATRDQIDNKEELIKQLRQEITLLAQEKFNLSVDEKIRDLQTERQLLGLKTEDVEVQRTLIALRNEAKKAGVELSKDQEKQIEAEIRKTEELKKIFEKIKTFSDSVGQTFASAFDEFIFGAKSAKEAVENLIKSLLRLVVQQVALQPLASGISGALQGFLKTAVSAKGNAFEHGKVLPFAAGGVLSGPSYFPLSPGLTAFGGERPEALMPLTRTGTNELAVKAVGSTSRPINIVYNISTPDANSFKAASRQIIGKTRRTINGRR